MAKSAAEALIKIEDVLPPDERQRVVDIEIHAPTELGQDHRILLDKLTISTRKKNLLELSYGDGTGRKSDRTVCLLAPWHWGKVWTLAAWCELREDFRFFRVDGIDKMIEIKATYRVEAGKRFCRLLQTTGSPWRAVRRHGKLWFDWKSA